MSYTAVTAAVRGLIFTQSLLFLMAVSSEESDTHEVVRQELVVSISVISEFQAKKKINLQTRVVKVNAIITH